MHAILDRQLHTLNLDPATSPTAEQWRQFLQDLDAALQVAPQASAAGRDDFLAGISHDMRTPLSTILGRVEALLDGLYDPLGEAQRRSLQVVEESARQLLGLVNDILDLSRLEAGKVQLEIGEVYVADVVRASLLQVQEQARRKQIQITTTADPAVVTVHADERRLCQMLINLLTNAVKYTPKGGSVWFEVEGDAALGIAAFRVRDNGVGIAEADLARLFQRYERLGAAGAVEAGTGLGLALVQLLTELHGGEIMVESELGRGSCFTVALAWQPSTPAAVTAPLPAELPAALPAEASAPSAPRAQPPLVLVVDDNEMNTTMLSDYLKVKGYRVASARNGRDAIQQARRLRPDVVLMDLQMPEMDGLEATHRLRQLPELQGLPIIGLTALAMPGDRERCLAAGANDYLSKPVSLRGLLGVIERELGRVGAAV